MNNSKLSKKWLKYAVINTAVITVVFCLIMTAFAAFVLNSGTEKNKKSLLAYSNRLETFTLSELKSATETPDPSPDLLHHSCSYVICVRNDAGDIQIFTSDSYLKSAASMNLRTEKFMTEQLNGASFLTYTVQLPNFDGNNVFLKVALPDEINRQPLSGLGWGIAGFVLLITVTALAVSIAVAYFQFKPIFVKYEKQHNFIYDLSHEIRTPLTVIKGTVENTMATPDAKIGDLTEAFADILSETEYISDMTGGLLDMVKVSKTAPAGKENAVSETVSEVVDIYSELASESGKSLIANIENSSAKLDKEKIKQLTVILLENSIKYTRPGDRIKVTFKTRDDKCILIVSDSGIGVKETELDKIFDRFYRGEKTVSSTSGTGLGLAIAKTIAESFDGSIYAKQNLPEGLTVIAELKIPKQ